VKAAAGFVTVNLLLALANVVAAGVIRVLADLALETCPEVGGTLAAYLAIGMTGVACAVLFVIGGAAVVQQPWGRMRP